MRDLASWSVGLRRWGGVHVRLHAFFFALAVVDLYLCTRHPHHGLLPYGLLFFGILLISVLLHEIAHTIAAFRVGGHVDQIVLWPAGGLAHPQVSRDAQQELVVALAGPLLNLIICLLAALSILAVDHEQDLVSLLHPLSPHGLTGGKGWIVGLKLTFWVNWMLVLTNMIPAFPLDGARVARALLRHWVDQRLAGQMVAWAGCFFALVLVAMACISWPGGEESLPDWVCFSALAILLYFSAKQEIARLEEADLEDELFNYDFSQGYTSLERNFDRSSRDNGPGTFRRWLAQRQQARARKQKLIEEEEERRVDEILARLHEGGMTGLSSKDRALLDRVSARYRNRQGS